ncbi:MAG: hypothetical protein IPM64_02520 [Phycisphaerales bacterium]|nr:hypothetical protein [Phycisphaerales bacterium]
MSTLIAAIPLIGLYAVVIVYHTTSAISSSWVQKSLENASATGVTHEAPLFAAALLLSLLLWLAALLYFMLNGYYGIKRSQYRNRATLVMIVILSWCVIQPYVTSKTLPQAMILKQLSDGAAPDAKGFIDRNSSPVCGDCIR